MQPPQYVNDYLRAREWIFWHWMVWLIPVYIVILIFVAVREYLEDISVNDESQDHSRNAGKTLFRQ